MSTRLPTPSLIDLSEQLYRDGSSIERISVTLGISRSTLRRRLIDRGVQFRQDHLLPKIPVSLWSEVIDQYLQGKSLKQVASEFNVTVETIRTILKRSAITRRSSTCYRYEANEKAFATIETSEQAYWLGWISADGCVAKHGRTFFLSFCIAQKDREHLVRFRQWLGSTAPIRDQINAGFGLHSVASQLQIHCHTLCLDLIRLGIEQRKSLTLQWPCLPTWMLPHYLRGYVDGDGCFSIYKKTKSLIFTVMSTEPFLLSLQQHLQDELSILPNTLRRAKCVAPIFTYVSGGSLRSLAIARFLYRDATVYLPRKREKVREFLRSRPDLAELYPDLL